MNMATNTLNSCFLVAVLLCSLFAESRADEVTEMADAKADKPPVVAATLRSFMPSHCVFVGSFQQTKKNELLTLKSSGTLFYNCNFGLVWQSRLPFSETSIYKKNGLLYRIDEERNVEKLSSQAQVGLAKFLLRLLNADADYFLHTFVITSKEKGLVLVPKGKFMKKAVDNIVLMPVPGQDGSALRLSTRINGADGVVTTVIIGDLQALQPVDNAQQDQYCERAMLAESQACKLLKRSKPHDFKR